MPANVQPALAAPLAAGHSLDNDAYTVRRTLADGGMSAIYLAADHRAFNRTVVIKALRPYFSPADPDALREAQALLEHEARTLAALRHAALPQIYALFHEGATVCLALEYIDGRDLEWGLTRYDAAAATPIDGKPYERAAVLDWGATLCGALAYLHSRTPDPVIHRDIKPANLLLDHAAGAIRLIDFGTAAGGGYGTPGYAAPEQYQGRSSPASDVYALAATLYHLSTDDDPTQHPFQFPLLDQLGTLGAVLRVALHHDAARRPTAHALRQQLDMLRGAAHAAAIAAPDGAVLADLPALVRWCELHQHEAAAWLYGALPDQLELWWRKAERAQALRSVVAAHADPAIGLDAALALLDPEGYGQQEVQISADRALCDWGALAAPAPPAQTIVLANSGRRVAPVHVRVPGWLEADPAALVLPAGQQAGVRLVPQLRRPWQIGALGGAAEALVGERPVARVAVRARAPLWPLCWHAARHVALAIALLVLLALLAAGTLSLRDSAARQSDRAAMYAAASAALGREDWREAQRLLRSPDIAAYRDAPTLLRESYYRPLQAAIARSAWGEAAAHLTALERIDPDYRNIRTWRAAPPLLHALRERLADGWQRGDVALRQTFKLPGPIIGLAWSPDGRVLAAGSTGGTVQLWRMPEGQPLRALTIGRPLADVAWSPDGRTIATADNTSLRLWRADDGALLQTIPTTPRHSVAFSPDGQTIASSGYDTSIRLWRVRDGAPLPAIEQPSFGGSQKGYVNYIAWSPDGQTIAAALADGSVRMYRVRDGARQQVLCCDEGVGPIAFSPDGQWIVGMSRLNMWRVANGTLARQPLPDANGVLSVAWSPDGQTIATGACCQLAQLRRASDGTLAQSFDGADGSPTTHAAALAFSRDGNTLAVGANTGTITLWQPQP